MATTSSSPSVDALTHDLGRFLQDLHKQLAADQLSTLERVGAGQAAEAPPDDAALDRLRRRGLVERAGRAGLVRLTADGRALLDELQAASARAVRRLVEGLDRGRRLRLAGALHLLSDSLDGTAVVAP
jgi:hypothetical protein